VTDPWADGELGVHARGRSGTSWMVRAALGIGLLSFVGVVAWGAYSLLSDAKTTKKQVVQISLLKPPPPPPPPPPPEQKPPEPDIKDEVKLPEPEQPPEAVKDEAPPPGEQLGLDANGSGSGDAFGLAARKGGTDITKLGGPSGPGRNQASWFAGLVQSHLVTQLSKEDKLRRSDYRVELRVWFAPDGRIERFELIDSTGNKEVDDQIKLTLHNMPPLKQPPPADLPQPVKLRLTSRGAA
jgi:periplasmic protein TonB